MTRHRVSLWKSCTAHAFPDAPCVLARGHEGDHRPRPLYAKFPPSLVATWTIEDALGWHEATLVELAAARRTAAEMGREKTAWEGRATGLAAIVRRLKARPKTLPGRDWEGLAVDWAAETFHPGTGDRPKWAIS